MFNIGPEFTCLANLPVCAWTWLEGLPFLYVLLAGVVIGMILGSILGKVGVAAVLTLGAAFLIWRKVEEPEWETGDNMQNVHNTPTKPKKRKTLLEAFEEIRNK